MENNDNVTW